MKNGEHQGLTAFAPQVGFAGSDCCARWHDALRRSGFERPRAWHLTPTMVGVPHERPRYFECAVRSRDGDGGAAAWTEADAVPLEGVWPVPLGGDVDSRPIADFLDCPASLDETPDAADRVEPWLLPASLLDRDAAWCLDVVDATERAPTACFTRSYGRFAKGTGSVLYVRADAADRGVAGLGLERSDPTDRHFGTDWKAKVHGKLRFFTPKEIANLLGFPRADFAFPASVSNKAAWAAMGNSLHVQAAAAVVQTALAGRT